MKRKGILLPVLLLGLAGTMLAQAATALVTGEVFYRNNQPAVNCTVKIEGKSDLVDNSGRFRIFEVPMGSQTLTVTCGQHVLRQEQVTISTSKVTIPKIVLEQ